MVKKILLAGIAATLFLSACKKQIEELKTPAISDYAPLEVGKYIIYKLDSTIYRLQNGIRPTINSYEAKFTVEDTLTDNLGRKVFRIGRELRKTAAQPWVRDLSIKITNTGNTYEYSENNLLFLNLALPIRQDYSWKGNNYLPTNPYASIDDFASAFTEDWDYIYQDVGAPLTVENLSFDNSITVLQKDDVLGDPTIPGTSFAEKTYSIEKYAKGVGLVYKDFIHWEFQGNNPGVADGTKGFGIKLTAIEHN